ncbi:peptidoglycan D,D-transpeptidase FtsI family protein [Gudongella sp. DL1XJH-153]|uniref:peptidoglycan D,D-transpeptidase FtsI family protein n=1 Tax=Gudongella sp. DL1XJH-153 TaxID=3409804 RepID=UPI003BB7F23D
MNNERKRIITILAAICLGFVLLIGYLSYFQMFEAQAVRDNSYNKRLWINEDNILRGSITDRNGEILVYSESHEGDVQRIYKYDNLYSHVIGYSLRDYGKSGLERKYNSYLVNANENTAINELINLINPSGIGNNLNLTIHHGLQKRTRELIGDKKGSVITLNPKTGEILSMVSTPDFGINSLSENWTSISENTESPMLNRGTQGLYTPGSVFKIVTATGVIQNGVPEAVYQCTGSTVIDGYTIRDFDESGHGSLNLEQAFSVSCNTYFAEQAVALGHNQLRNISEDFFFNRSIEFELETNKSVFPAESIGLTDLGASGIGQGRVLATPLNMLMITAAVANDGYMPMPYIVEAVRSPQGQTIMSHVSESKKVLQIGEAQALQRMMREVVRIGTGANAAISGVEVAGKTGTAENSSGRNHAWFVGFAPLEDPEVAVVVLLEEEGSSGGRAAAPIARELMDFALKNISN